MLSVEWRDLSDGHFVRIADTRDEAGVIARRVWGKFKRPVWIRDEKGELVGQIDSWDGTLLWLSDCVKGVCDD